MLFPRALEGLPPLDAFRRAVAERLPVKLDKTTMLKIWSKWNPKNENKKTT